MDGVDFFHLEQPLLGLLICDKVNSGLSLPIRAD